ncbi:MAG: hypothetical protein ACLSHL_09850 [Alistipes communis]
MKHIIKKLSLLLAVALTAACGDMKLQTDADYDYSGARPPYPDDGVGVFRKPVRTFSANSWRPIEYAGMKEYYTQTGREYTFLALTNTGRQSVREHLSRQVENHRLPEGGCTKPAELPHRRRFLQRLRGNFPSRQSSC